MSFTTLVNSILNHIIIKIFQSHKKNLETVPCFRDHMLANAETDERRKRRLDHFFREAYALTFGLKPGEKRKVGNLITKPWKLY